MGDQIWERRRIKSQYFREPGRTATHLTRTTDSVLRPRRRLTGVWLVGGWWLLLPATARGATTDQDGD